MRQTTKKIRLFPSMNSADNRATPGGVIPARPVSELALTEQIIVWSLRRYRAARCGIEPLAPTYRQIFGLTEPVDASLACSPGIPAARGYCVAGGTGRRQASRAMAVSARREPVATAAAERRTGA